jgi:hypothetical protein
MFNSTLLAGTSHLSLHFDEPVAVFQQDATTIQTGEIEVNTLILKQDYELVCLVSIDTLYTSTIVRDAVLRLVPSTLGLKVENLILIASHSHNAPVLDDTKPYLCKCNPAFKDNATKIIAESIVQAVDNLQAVSIHFGKDSNNLAINRRALTWGRTGVIPVKKYKMIPNPVGPVDNLLRSWQLRTKEGKYLAIMWSFGCHPVAYPKINVIHPDYVGDVRTQLRKEIGKDIPVLFFPGFLGNIRPALFGKPTNLKDLFYFAAHGQIFKKPSIEGYLEFCQKMYLSLKNSLTNSDLLETKHLKLARTTVALKTLLKSPQPGSLELFALSGIGKQLFLMASAEVLVEYESLLKPHLDLTDDTIVPIGCVNSVFGYLPVDKQLKEGGYEVDLFMPWFSLGGNEFYDHIEHEVIDPWVAIARRSREPQAIKDQNGE